MALAPQTNPAKTVEQLWRDMPQELLPYLSAEQRGQMADLYAMGDTAGVDNRLGGKSRIGTLSAEYAIVEASGALEIQLCKLPGGSDSLLCLVSTVSGPAKESRISIYTQEWEHVKDIVPDPSLVVCRPDSVSPADFEKAVQAMQPALVAADLSQGGGAAVFSVSAALPFKEDSAIVGMVGKERKFVWDCTSMDFIPADGR